MKALTMHQPWASLVALGVKTIETRSWATEHRGPLAIHAGVRRPPLMHLPPYPPGREPDPPPRFTVIDTITDPAHQRPHRPGERVPLRSKTPTLFFPYAGPYGRPWDDKAGTDATEQGTAVYLPLGAVVATCALVDVVPTERIKWEAERFEVKGQTVEWSRTAMIDGIDARVAEDQRPYGDFSPGRYAWLLADVQALPEPVPARGRQGLWKWAAP